jgi:tetratricopeptide (TPR) repeat protein
MQVHSMLFVGLLLLALLPNAYAETPAEQANALFQAGEWQQSVDAYQALSRAEPSEARYWLRLGGSYHKLAEYDLAIAAFQSALENRSADLPAPQTLLYLARAQAAAGNEEGAVASIVAVADTGAKPYLATKSSVEFAGMASNANYQAALELLQPCTSEQHRAFDFWIGEWDVTTPASTTWLASSSITVANNGCSIHESYRTPSGLAGMSINFYDAGRKLWHQSWIDNQGAPIYLEGNLVDGAMVLTDATSRVTWSWQPDGQVRQHWESTTDEGKTWSTAFDGYYRRKPVTSTE